MEGLLNKYDSNMLFIEAQAVVCETSEYNLFSMLKPKIYQDGNEWCVLYGEDIQAGICGFGKSPYFGNIGLE